MRAQSFPVGILAAAAVLAALPGCGGSGKELPKVVEVRDEKGDAPTVTVPTKSEAAAVAVVERAIKVATDGHPERIEKAKTNRVAMKGVVIRPTGPVATIRKIEAVWPDRFALADEFNDGGPVKVLMRLRRPLLWTANQREGKTTPVEFPDIKVYEAAFSADAAGRHWLALLVPLADPKTIVFDAKKQTVNGQTWDAIKASVPGCPVFTIWFDEKTGHLGRIDFAHLEPGRPTPTQKVFTLGLHRAFDGVIAPAKIDYRENAILVEEWNVDSWEFPDRLDDAGFDPPK